VTVAWAALRESEEGRARKGKSRGRERASRWRSYPRGRDNGGGGHLLTRIDGVGFARQLLAAGGGRREEEVGWAVGGFQQGKERRRVGLETAQSKGSYFFSFKTIFYFYFSKILCYFIKRVCRFKIIYENLKLFSHLHNK
jgi:hypothetical protein